jgi:acyl carrier protein
MTTTTGTLTVYDIVDIVIGLLAEQAHVQPGDLRAELEAAGQELPVNSLLVVEVLTKVEAACGVRLPVTKAVAMSTRSVLSFAWAVRRQLAAKGEAGDGE